MKITQSQLDCAIEAKLTYSKKVILLLCNPDMTHLDFSGLHNMKPYDQSEFDEMNSKLKEFTK